MLPGEDGVPHDDRLRLLFTCCHPALGLDAQVALTLRAVAGLTTREIARAFLVPRHHHGSAARACEAEDPGRGDPVPGAGRAGRPGSARRGPGRHLSGLQRGLHGRGRRGAHPGRAVPRGDPARPPGGRAGPGRPGAPGPPRAPPAPALPSGRPARRRGPPGAPRGPGPLRLGRRPHRRGNDPRGRGHRPRARRLLSDPGRHRRAPRRQRHPRGHRLEADRGALRRPGPDPAHAGGPAEPGGGRGHGRRDRQRARPGRSPRRRARIRPLRPLPRRPGRPPAARRTPRRGRVVVPPRHRAGRQLGRAPLPRAAAGGGGGVDGRAGVGRVRVDGRAGVWRRRRSPGPYRKDHRSGSTDRIRTPSRESVGRA